MAQLQLPQDQVISEQHFTRGLVKDSQDIPAGGLNSSFDFLVHKPGLLFKRGGWSRHSSVLGGTRANWASALNVPSKLVAIDSNNNLWDVTTPGTAVSVGPVGFSPLEHSSQYINMVILCDPTCVSLPKKVFYSTGSGLVSVAQLGGVDAGSDVDGPLTYAFSTVYSGRIVLGRGPNNNTLQRIHFSPLPDVEAPWVPLMYIDTSYDITGLASIGGVLLVFSAQHVERILGGVPPAEEGSDMQLQPVAGVGCLDARSIVTWDNNIIFAGEEGVWFTNGAGVESLTEKADGTGIMRYWQQQFPRDARRYIIGGLFDRDFYIVSITNDTYGIHTTFMCHLPSRAWTMLRNINTTSLVQGRTGQGVLELYSADGGAPYVNRLTDILTPYQANANDGDGQPVQPSFETRNLDADSASLKAYGFGRISYLLNVIGFAPWSPNHPYALNTLIMENNHIYRVTKAGTSGNIKPFFVPVLTPITDGTMEWTNDDPVLNAIKITEIGRDKAAQLRELRQTTKTFHVARDRFQLFGDYQSLSVGVIQEGPSARTEVYYVEVETRPYPPGADFNTGPEFGDIQTPGPIDAEEP